jgi:hypothetical protein
MGRRGCVLRLVAPWFRRVPRHEWFHSHTALAGRDRGCLSARQWPPDRLRSWSRALRRLPARPRGKDAQRRGRVFGVAVAPATAPASDPALLLSINNRLPLRRKAHLRAASWLTSRLGRRAIADYGSDECTCFTGFGRLKSLSFSQPSRAKGTIESPDGSLAIPSERTDPPTTIA